MVGTAVGVAVGCGAVVAVGGAAAGAAVADGSAPGCGGLVVAVGTGADVADGMTSGCAVDGVDVGSIFAVFVTGFGCASTGASVAAGTSVGSVLFDTRSFAMTAGFGVASVVAVGF